MMNVSVQKKKLSNGLAVVLLNIEGQDGMLQQDVTSVLGIPQQTMSDYLKANKHLKAHRISGEPLATLKQEKVVDLFAARATFLTKETIQELVRDYRTPATDAIYAELWNVAQAVQSGDLAKAQAAVGLSDDDALEHLEIALQLAKKFKAERDVALRTKAQIGSKRESTAMNTARAAKAEANEAKAEVISLQERLGEAANWKTAAGWISELKLYLHELNFGRGLAAFSRSHGLAIKTTPHIKFGSVNVYSRTAVESYLKSSV